MAIQQPADTIIEPVREIEVFRKVDVVVVGGGPAASALPHLRPAAVLSWPDCAACLDCPPFAITGSTMLVDGCLAVVDDMGATFRRLSMKD